MFFVTSDNEGTSLKHNTLKNLISVNTFFVFILRVCKGLHLAV